jgi:hypothetical protein
MLALGADAAGGGDQPDAFGGENRLRIALPERAQHLELTDGVARELPQRHFAVDIELHDDILFLEIVRRVRLEVGCE